MDSSHPELDLQQRANKVLRIKECQGQRDVSQDLPSPFRGEDFRGEDFWTLEVKSKESHILPKVTEVVSENRSKTRFKTRRPQSHSLTQAQLLKSPPCFTLPPHWSILQSTATSSTAPLGSHLSWLRTVHSLLAIPYDFPVGSYMALLCPSQTTWKISSSPRKPCADLYLFQCSFLCPEHSSSLSLPGKILLPFRGSVQMLLSSYSNAIPSVVLPK